MSEQLESELSDLVPALNTSDLSAFAADAEMVAEFAVESREHLATVEEGLLLLEKNSSDLESINAVFRAVHTIKGLAGFLELQAIQEIAHEVETLLDHARSRRLVITPPLLDALFEGIDSIRLQVDGVQLQLAGSPPPPATANAALMLRIREIGSNTAAAQAAGEPDAEDQEQACHAETAPTARPVEAPSMLATTPVTSRSSAPSASDSRAPSLSPASNSQTDELSVRIETAKLDQLMEMVGELVIANTMVSHNPHLSLIKDQRLAADLALLSRITTEVQRITTSMRMVPIGNQFQKTARIVRDLSRQLGKQVVTVTSGEETELDKSIAEALADPLMHMVRNSIDHGIEPFEERALTGKDPVAQIRLAAFHRSAQIVIEISDDGRGLDRDRILLRATERGLVKPGTQLSDAETFQLIFEPGFSTAEKITGISGRGVGMDVVRKHVQKLRGRIDIQSEAGVGTTFFLRLPLTLAIIEGLVAAVGGNRYILPLYAVWEIFRPSEPQLWQDNAAGEMVTLRGIELPIVRLYKRFDLVPRSEALTDGILIVTEAEGKRFCLFVDEMLGKQKIVIKSLGETFKDCTGLMGCAILSDGRVGLILDVEGIMP
jgi:two-component system chemotaxis sensor kinase CheA